MSAVRYGSGRDVATQTLTDQLGTLAGTVGQVSRSHFLAKETIDTLSKDAAVLRNLAPHFGQVSEQADSNGASVKSVDALAQSGIAAIGQLVKQINGGRIALTAGAASAPALRIGEDIAVYCPTTNAIVVSVNGTEMLRIDSSGLTVYGSIQEA